MYPVDSDDESMVFFPIPIPFPQYPSILLGPTAVMYGTGNLLTYSGLAEGYS